MTSSSSAATALGLASTATAFTAPDVNLVYSVVLDVDSSFWGCIRGPLEHWKGDLRVDEKKAIAPHFSKILSVSSSWKDMIQIEKVAAFLAHYTHIYRAAALKRFGLSYCILNEIGVSKDFVSPSVLFQNRLYMSVAKIIPVYYQRQTEKGCKTRQQKRKRNPANGALITTSLEQIQPSSRPKTSYAGVLAY